VEERALPGSGGAHHGDDLAADPDIHAAQNLHRVGALAKRLVQVAAGENVTHSAALRRD
jgi:hypothetical protein